MGAITHRAGEVVAKNNVADHLQSAQSPEGGQTPIGRTNQGGTPELERLRPFGEADAVELAVEEVHAEIEGAEGPAAEGEAGGEAAAGEEALDDEILEGGGGKHAYDAGLGGGAVQGLAGEVEGRDEGGGLAPAPGDGGASGDVSGIAQPGAA